MSQNILDEFLSEWDETEKQPDPIEFGFNSLRDMLDQCSDIMDDLGASVNRNRENLAKAQTRIAELEQAHDSRGLGALALVEKQQAQIEAMVDEKKAQRDRIAELEAENAQQAQTILYLTAQCQECVEQLQNQPVVHTDVTPLLQDEEALSQALGRLDRQNSKECKL